MDTLEERWRYLDSLAPKSPAILFSNGWRLWKMLLDFFVLRVGIEPTFGLWN